MSTSLLLFYCPFPTLDAARAVATKLLEARSVACCNLIPIAESLYWWEGKLAATPEIALLAKTTPAQAAAVEAMILAHHPYDCPAVLQFPVSANAAFSQWVSAQVIP